MKSTRFNSKTTCHVQRPITLRAATWAFLLACLEGLTLPDARERARLAGYDVVSSAGWPSLLTSIADQPSRYLYVSGILDENPQLLERTVVMLQDGAEYVLDAASVHGLRSQDAFIRVRTLDRNRYVVPRSLLETAMKEGCELDQLDSRELAS